MNRISILLTFLIAGHVFISCNPKEKNTETNQPTEFKVEADRFADLQVLRYQVPGFESLSQQQKELAYYLYMAGMSGRDIFYDQKYKHNLRIRKVLECILTSYQGDSTSSDYLAFVTYAKRVFFSNGIHHHYSSEKFEPGFSFEFFASLVKNSDESMLPLTNGMTVDELLTLLQPVMFDPSVDATIVDLTADADNIARSANNYYENVTQKEVEVFYKSKFDATSTEQPAWGLNSKLMKENNVITEKVWKVGGMYDKAITQIVYWLEKAMAVAENDQQKKALELLASYYTTGDLKTYDEYCIAWVQDTESRIDFANGFIEVYQDAIGKKGAYEAVLSLKDMEASKRIETISQYAQWFEDNSPLMEEHKKKSVTGISAKVITAINEVGDAAPSTPIGINLPNQEWIREKIGSKSVSLGNIVDSYNAVKAKSPTVSEFASSKEVADRIKKHGTVASNLHTDMHEVIGHASGKINDGVGTTDETLKNYSSALEEARADLVALYYIMDQKLIDIGVMNSVDVGKSEYDSYIMNGLMIQLNRIKPGDNIQEAHMRNRQLVAAWALEKGAAEKVIEKVTRDGKTYFVINDYDKLRTLFGQLLREIQRIKSEGDFNAGRDLIENYAVKVDQSLHKEVLERFEKLDVAPYSGFVQPKLIPVMTGDKITDVKIEYPENFMEQMLEYGKDFSFLDVMN